MLTISPNNFITMIILALFCLGLISILAGIFILVTRAYGKEVRTLTDQTKQLVQKGFAEEVAGLVGHAASLLSSVNELIANAAGIGVTLMIIGFILICAAGFFTLQIY